MQIVPAVQHDLSLLLPSYLPKVNALLTAMVARGFKPRVFETRRSDARCLFLQQRGSSRNGMGSMHRYGAAVDIIDAHLLWDNPHFFTALGEEAVKLRLTWGGDWDSNPATHQSFDDRPHVQAIPLGRQDIFRALINDAARDAYLVRFFARP